ncbi:cell division protein FtsX [Flavobacterium aurantiibacter]|uniref:Cell division protein FtsX n=1 Tax=Flavobacterium aurantiibacter TaxID=2023067 RepID=A0A255ZTQ8_9FLAO|nr:permease-like cell division protein FtsX [Flavobacterium aurantiibacter]OYQ44304.1 cell division protein FtsX [Flavobacterium aurantiibacter]
MASSYDKFQKRRLITSYFSAVLSVFLVLFLLGALGLFVINSKKLADNFKEEIAVTVFFKNEATDSTLTAFSNELKTAKFVKKAVYVSKEQAAKNHSEVVGEDFISFLGVNPLQNSFDVYLKADYVVRDSIDRIEDRLRKNEMIGDVVYDKQIVKLVNENIQKISLWMLIISGVFALISVLIINSSMRLSIYSKRFIIKTMQMVGATKAFIRKPFIWTSVKLGMIGGVLAVIALIALLLWIDNANPGLGVLDEPIATGIILLAVFGLGVLITFVSTFFATQRFLNLRTDDLY